MAKLQNRAFLIEVAVLILTHAEYLFIIVCFEAGGYLVVRAALTGLQFPAVYPQRNAVAVDAVAVAPVLLGEHFPALIQEREPALIVKLHGQLPVSEVVVGACLVVLSVFLALVPRVGGVYLLAADSAGVSHRLGQRAEIRRAAETLVLGDIAERRVHSDPHGACAPRLDYQARPAEGRSEFVVFSIYSHGDVILSKFVLLLYPPLGAMSSYF